MKIIVSIFLSLAVMVSFTMPVHAVTSNCVVTKIGDPGAATPVLPAECASGPVVDWGQKIADKLEKGGNSYYSKLQADVCNGGTCAHKKRGPSGSCKTDSDNCYWCSWLIIDAYTLAGNKVPENLSAQGLLSDMQKLPGFTSAGPSGTAELKKVKPGFAIAFGGEGHIGLVKSIQVDDRGNGQIITIEANSDATTHTWPIAGGEIKKGGEQVIGFAGK